MPASFTKILRLLTPAQRKSAAVLLGLMVISMVLETLGVGLVIPVLVLMTHADISASYPAVSPVLAWLGHPSQQALVVGAMLGFVGVNLAKNLILTVLAWRQARFVSGVKTQLSQRLFAIYLRQPYTFHLQRNSAQLIHNATGMVGALPISTAMVAFVESLTFFGIASLVLTIEPLILLIVVSVLGLATWGFHRVTRDRIADWGQARKHHAGLRIQHLMQGLGGAKDVKLLGREGDFLAQFNVHSIQSARMDQRQHMLKQLPRIWLELLTVAGLAALALGMLAQGREMTSIVPTLGLFVVAAYRLMPSANRILGAVQSLGYSLPVIDTLHEELKLASPEPAGKSDRTALNVHQEIRLDNVSYAYPSAPALALDRVSMCIQRNESVGLIGPSGSGKSTLVDVLLGLLTPANGQVRADGNDIQQNLRGWQDQIGYVPQSIYLTDDTLRRNVAFGLPEEQIDDAAVNKTIMAAQLNEFVASLPKGLETLVGERGMRLSGGQRQRIGIARALYHDPAVLVLDEATSSLDIAAERSVMDAVTTLQGSKTLLIHNSQLLGKQ